MKEKKTYLKVFEIISLSIFSVFIGIIIGSFLNFVSNEEKIIVINEDFKEIEAVYEEILDKFYKDVDKNELIQGAIEGMLSTLGDPNSSFLDSKRTLNFSDRMSGSYKGIGVEILDASNNEVLIVNVFDNSPALKAGIKVGDIIMYVDDKDVSDFKSFEVANLIKYKAEDDLTISVKRKDEILKLELTKEEIILNSVEKEIFEVNNKKKGYLKISIFAANTYSQFKELLLELEEEEIDELIIDVRNNSGGYLSSVSNLLELFIEKDEVLYKMQTREGLEIVRSKTLENRNYPIKVLVNRFSASASEIMAVSLKETYNATLFGEKTYGKGTVQETSVLSTGAMTKITIKEWLSPKGNKIEGIGVTPNVEITLDESYFEDRIYINDNQLQEALKN